MPKIQVEDFNTIVAEEMPWAHEVGFAADALGPGTATCRLPYDDSFLRPGGTVSGPTMMLLADATMYAVVLSAIGRVTLAVTTNFNINFLRKPGARDLIAEGKAIKVGKRLAILEVTLYCEGDEDPVAHATGTYSIPPNRD
ncbi:PaaI family thioesterase [Magnetovibrio sp. PR-2]|uniref:PaaI family thioesterase n=1 Tax=Magnetovibrio sp. PR-2 TaxID=3120356 RepID=UPI002FCE1E44